MANNDIKVLNIGSISHGTMLPEDLIPTFFSEFEDCDSEAARKYRWKNRKFFNWLDDPDARTKPYSDEETAELEETKQYILEELFDILNEYTPDYCTFGASEGDGTDYGCWISEWAIRDAIEDGELVKIDGLDELDEMMANGNLPKRVIDVNDHGNMTLYNITLTVDEKDNHYDVKMEYNEVWAVV